MAHQSIQRKPLAESHSASRRDRGEIKLRTRKIYIVDQVEAKAVREKSGLSQNDFALLYGFNPRTLQEWEREEQHLIRPYSLSSK
jgi:DNA-binding transcriptional regulator YiaG